MLQLNQHLTSFHKFILTNIDLGNLAIKLSFNHQLHFHSLHRQQRISFFNYSASLVINFSNCSRHRRFSCFLSKSISFFKCFHFVRFKTEAELISIMIENMNCTFLDEILLFSDLPVNNNSQDIFIKSLDFVCVFLTLDNYNSPFGANSLYFAFKFKILSK